MNTMYSFGFEMCRDTIMLLHDLSIFLVITIVVAWGVYLLRKK